MRRLRDCWLKAVGDVKRKRAEEPEKAGRKPPPIIALTANAVLARLRAEVERLEAALGQSEE